MCIDFGGFTAKWPRKVCGTLKFVPFNNKWIALRHSVCTVPQ